MCLGYERSPYFFILDTDFPFMTNTSKTRSDYAMLLIALMLLRWLYLDPLFETKWRRVTLFSFCAP